LGKELFARAIHFNGSRRNNPFVPINCSVIPEKNLLESELYGYIKGAFTSVVNSKKELFEDVASFLQREMKGGAKQLMKGGQWKVLR